MTDKNQQQEASNSNQGTIEADPDDVANPDEQNEEEEGQEDELDSNDSEAGEDEEDSHDQEDSDDEGEYEIVLEGDEGLSDKEQKTQKFHNRMNERKAETLKAQESEAKVSAELEAKDRELALYKQMLEKQTGGGVPQGPPNPDNYDGGSYDPKYIQDINTFHANKAAVDANQRILQARLEDEQKKKVEDKKKEVEKAYESHYQRATDLDKKLKKKDYDETEKVSLDILGEAKSDFIVETFDNSELIFYKFGKDKAKAKYFSDLLDRYPAKAIKELAIFESRIKKVKRKINKTPEPESKSKGGYIKSKKGERGPPGAKYK